MLASALALASFSAAADLACSSAVGLASAALAVAALDFAGVLALVVVALDLVVLAFAFVALALVDEDLLALDFEAALAFFGSAAANNSSAAAERSLALALPVRAVRRRAGFFLVSSSALGVTVRTCPSALASRTMSNFAADLAAGLMVVPGRR